MGFVEAPFCSNLANGEAVGLPLIVNGLEYRWLDDRPVGGLMVPFLGQRYTLEELSATDDGYSPGIERFRAWPVLSLKNVSFSAPTQAHIPTVVLNQLRQCCPGIDWGHPGERDGPLQKYGILHLSIPAPPDTTTGQPMGLELYGQVKIDPNSPAFQDGIISWFSRGKPGSDFNDRFPPLEGPIYLVLETATYANVRYPGVGVPFYM